jgi:hypothetical protein
MLGEQLSEASGTVTGVRVLGAGGEDHKLEVSFRGRGEMLGVGITDMGIFVQTIRPGGVLIGEDSNVLMLTDDGETVSWKGFGVGRPTGPGSPRAGGSPGPRTRPPERWCGSTRWPRWWSSRWRRTAPTGGSYGNGRERRAKAD